MGDMASVAGFEMIDPPPRPCQDDNAQEDKQSIDELKALIAKSTPNNVKANELATDDVPDVSYVLQYMGWNGRVVDDDLSEDGKSSIQNSIIEVVTTVSTTWYGSDGETIPRVTSHRRRKGYGIYDDEYDDCLRQNSNFSGPRVFKKIAEVEKTYMTIGSIHLINTLRAVVGYYPTVRLVGDSISITAPYTVLVHHWPALASYKDNQPNTHDEEYALTTAKHIDVLLNFLEKTLGNQIREEENRHSRSIPSATFERLDLIYKPGDVVYAKENHKWTAFIITSFLTDHIPSIGQMHKFTIKAFAGEEAIANLPVIPARFFRGENGDMTPQEVVDRQSSDIVENKGQGRIFLLHGSPGVGKTCNAECVAELTGRSLISLTSGDLGNSFAKERDLEYFLQLAERYGALILLNEADVYLEARRAKDISRNSLVSAFLRVLEYFRGIMFLTTNRVQTFDEAFTSRIDVALHYKALRDADREKIWANGFEHVEHDSGGKVHAVLAAREYVFGSRDVRGLRWNGREIRNALRTAVSLAEAEALEAGHENVTVTDKHLRAVVKMSRGFKTFMRRQKLRSDAVLEDDEDDDDNEEEEENIEPEGYISDADLRPMNSPADY
ncbi:hypothetical protein M426DRAFT_26325 [Hypoxylon sp. CI-4A]|nr:hypothetical protein M426DRAFT_26325 [Hypoxylon sp. CI-4A]